MIIARACRGDLVSVAALQQGRVSRKNPLSSFPGPDRSPTRFSNAFYYTNFHVAKETWHPPENWHYKAAQIGDIFTIFLGRLLVIDSVIMVYS